MAVLAVRSVIESILQDPLFHLGSQATTEDSRKLAQDILQLSVGSTDAASSFEAFATNLLASLEKACTVPATVKCESTRRERCWSAFHRFQVQELPALWSSLTGVLKCKEAGMALFTQHVNQKLFEKMLTKRARSKVHGLVQKPLTAGEANALRYAAGYVPFALKNKLSHRPEFVHCLNSIAVSGKEQLTWNTLRSGLN